MIDEQGGYIARRPRHQTAGSPDVRVLVERGEGEDPTRASAELLDLSRTGIRLRTAASLAVDESLTVEIRDESSGLQLTRPATVRWTSPEPDGKWSVGCLFAEQVDWPTLGELFLNDVLSTERSGNDECRAPSGNDA
jgi:hypothetical protein